MKVRQQVLDIEDSADIVYRILIDRYARVIVLHNTFDDVGKRRAEVQVNHILTAGHNFLGCLVTKADDSLQHVLFILQLLLVGQLQRLLQVVNAEDMCLFLHHLLCQDSRADEHAGQGIEKAAKACQGTRERTADRECVLLTVDFRHNFAKEQQDESQQNGDHEKLQPHGSAEVHDMGEEVVAQHDDGHIHQIVGNQNGSQRALRLGA